MTTMDVMSQPQVSDTTQTQPVHDDRKGAVVAATRSLQRYRVMAYITGVMLLLLCVEMLLNYVFHADAVVAYIKWIPYVHGWIYVLYLVTVFDLWSKMRWTFGRLATMVISGVVPVMSFIVEKRVHSDGQAKIDAAAATIL